MHQTITHTELEAIVRLNLSTGRWQPIILLGAPGTGKSWFFRNRLPEMYAEALGIDVDEVAYVEEQPALRDAAEIAGVALPVKDAEGNVFTQFTISPLIKRIEATGKDYIILNWDEVAAARDPEQKVATESFDPESHSIGGQKLPPGCIVVGTGNRAHDKAGSTRLMAHLVDRALVFNLVFDFPSWKRWAVDHAVNPVAIDCAESHHEQGFFADAVPTEDTSYCTPRSLTRAALHLDACMGSEEFTGIVPRTVEKMIAANVGHAAAATLTQWVGQHGKLPAVEDILRNPHGAMVPDQTGFQMIAAHRAMGAVEDAQSAESVMHYILRLRTDLRVSLCAKLLRHTAREGWIITDPAASEFIAKHHELLPLVE